MASIEDEALAGLTAGVEALLPPQADPDLRPALTLASARLAPSGVGGFVASSPDPVGEIRGCRVDATVLVTVRAPSAADLGASVSAVTRSLLGADRAALASRGIQRVSLGEAEARPPPTGPLATRRDLSFRVLYEHLRGPAAAEGVIEAIPLSVEAGRSGRAPRTWSRSGFAAGDLSLFDVVDDPLAGTGAPSQWAVNEAESRLEQRSRIRGGPNALGPQKPGTYLILRAGAPAFGDHVLHTCVTSEDTGGAGVVFRWVDVDNFYFFLMDQAGGYRLLGKKVGGVFSALDVPAQDASKGYDLGRSYDLRVTAAGDHFQVCLDGRPALEGRDGSHARGRVGLLSRNDNRAWFHRLAVTEL